MDLIQLDYDGGTIQRIAESLRQGGFGKYDKDRYTAEVP